MPKLELHKVAFVNPSDLTETVVLSTILEGAGGATRSFVEEEPEAFVFEDDQEIKDGQVFTFTMAGRPTASSTQLVTWADEGTKLTIVGYSYKESVLIEDAVLTFLPDSSERLVWKITARKAGEIGYNDDGKLGTEFMISQNLLNMYYWQEGSTSDLVAGWSKTGGSTTWDDANSEQDFSTTGATAVYLQRDVYFPFDKQVTFRLDFTEVTETTGIEMILTPFDDAGNDINDYGNTSITTGVNIVTIDLPKETVYIRLGIKIGQDDSVSVKNPALNIGTSTEYISQ